MTLDQAGVQSINISYTNSDFIDGYGNEHRLIGSFTNINGTINQAVDVWFKEDKANTVAVESLDVPGDIAALPNLQGYGNVYELHQAIIRDTSGNLKPLVESFATTTDIEQRTTLLDEILFQWTGSEDIDPTSRGQYIDARKVAVLEKFVGKSWNSITQQSETTTNIGSKAAALLQISYDKKMF